MTVENAGIGMTPGLTSGVTGVVEGITNGISVGTEGIVNMTTGLGYGQDGVGAGNFDPNSAMRDLAYAIGRLAGYAIDDNLEMVDGKSTSLAYSAYCSQSISDIFVNVNKTVSDAWSNVANFMYETDGIVAEFMEKFVTELRIFAESTQFNEKQIVQSANKANEVAQEILNKLKETF